MDDGSSGDIKPDGQRNNRNRSIWSLNAGRNLFFRLNQNV